MARNGEQASDPKKAMAELEAALRQAATLLRTLKAENDRLKSRAARAGRFESGGPERGEPADDGGAGGRLYSTAPVSELAARVVELEEQRREWLRDRRRLAERVEGILDKLEYLQAETTAS